MVFERLANPPLVEAILEVKWRIGSASQPTETPPTSGIFFGQPPMGIVDPSYDLLVGRLSNSISSLYPFHEKLPSATIPADIAPFLIQHRFRNSKDGWPLVQMGAGILTLNDVTNYRWSDFCHSAITLLNILFEIHPQKSELRAESLSLRYLDAEPFDYTSADALRFLREKLKINFELPRTLFQGDQAGERPEGVNFQIVYPSKRPKGVVQLKVGTGNIPDRRAIIWETSVLSRGQDVVNLPSGAEEWLEAAHALTHDWFSKLVEGELMRRYSGNG